jgi:hypothetical protein
MLLRISYVKQKLTAIYTRTTSFLLAQNYIRDEASSNLGRDTQFS